MSKAIEVLRSELLENIKKAESLKGQIEVEIKKLDEQLRKAGK